MSISQDCSFETVSVCLFISGLQTHVLLLTNITNESTESISRPLHKM